MSLLLGDIVPDFKAPSTKGDIYFHQWISDSWCILFSHPADFTPVCTTELGEVAQLRGEFEKRQIKVLALSVDPLEKHVEWVKDIESIYGCPVYFPILADEKFEVSTLFKFIHPKASITNTVRSVVIIGPDKTVKLTLTYPASTGRNFDEILRVIDSLQLHASKGLLTPANWQMGQPVVVPPSVRTEEITVEQQQSLEVIKPYLRKIKMPDLKK